MANKSIFGAERDNVKNWLVSQSKVAQRDQRPLHLNELVKKARARWPEMLAPKPVKVVKRDGKSVEVENLRAPGVSKASLTQAIYRLLIGNKIWFGYDGKHTKATAPQE